jgi:hypothetical protein
MNLGGDKVKAAQTLTHAKATCADCPAHVTAKNAQTWASAHVRANPSHRVRVVLDYFVEAE